MTYFFILGKNTKLSASEIDACFGAQGELSFLTPNVLLLETKNDFDAVLAMKQLGGTIKIGEIIGKIKNISELSKLVSEKIENNEGKFYFGISNYAGLNEQEIRRAAMEIKKEMKKSGPVRWVVSKEKILSSVIVKTNKLLQNGAEICLFNNGFIGKTLAVQEFEEYEERDFSKPQRNILRGMLPPKLAKIMINLSGIEKDGIILDPFCGTGTVLMEALSLGYKNLFGSDLDSKAIKETKENLEWLAKKNNEKLNYNLFISPADKISEKINKIQPQGGPFGVDAIITEPYLGPLLRGNEPENKIRRTISELEEIYLKSFADWKKILKKNSRVVMIFPIFSIKDGKFNLQIEAQIKKIGYKKVKTENLIYERPGQKILRSIEIFESL
jgi:tRNA (guanine10-N2)-dimethyltransferase